MPVKLEELSSYVTYAEQMNQTTGPIVLINTFSLPPDVAAGFPEIWSKNATHMKRQPGFISSQLHRGIAGSGVFVNVAIWESVAALAAAVRSPEFQALNALLPDGVIARPHIFEKVAVPGICVA